MEPSPDVEHEEEFPDRLLHQAALWDNLELLQESIASGADVNGLDTHGRTALHGAVVTEPSRCITALSYNGTSLDVRSDAQTGEKTALHIAAERGHAENVRTLLAAGADVTVTDAAGDTALALAEQHSQKYAAAALRDAAQRAELRLAVFAGLWSDAAGVAAGGAPGEAVIEPTGDVSGTRRRPSHDRERSQRDRDRARRGRAITRRGRGRPRRDRDRSRLDRDRSRLGRDLSCLDRDLSRRQLLRGQSAEAVAARAATLVSDLHSRE